MDKRTETGLLLDFYGALLSRRQLAFMDAYFNDDLSLGEIAEREKISRQAVRDAIAKGEEQLHEYEEKLGFFARDTALVRELKRISAECDDNTADKLRRLIERMEGSDGV